MTFHDLMTQLNELERKRHELGIAAYQEIKSSDGEMSSLLRETFDSNEHEISAWLTDHILILGASPVAVLAHGERDEVIRVLANICHGLCA